MRNLPTSRTETIIFLIFSVLIVPLLYSRATLDPTLITRTLALTILSLGFFIYITVRVLSDHEYYDVSILRKYIFQIWLIFLVFVGISIFNAENRSEAVVDLIKHILVFIYLVISTLILSKRDDSFKLICKLVTLFSIIILGIGSYQIYDQITAGSFDHQASYKVSALFAHRNLYSQIILLSIPFSIASIIILRNIWRILAIISVPVSIGFIAILLTKTVWIAFLGSAFLTFILTIAIFYKQLKRKKYSFWRIGSLFLIFIVILFLSAFLVSRISGKDILKQQTYWLKSTQFGSAKERLELWERSSEMAKENPWIGIGSGNWKIMIAKHGTKDMRSETGEVFFQRPHNDFIWVLSESGIIAMLSYILIFCIVLFYILRILKRTEDLHTRIYTLMMFFFLTAYIAISLLSFPKERIEHTIFLILSISSITTIYHKQNNKVSTFKTSVLIHFVGTNSHYSTHSSCTKFKVFIKGVDQFFGIFLNQSLNFSFCFLVIIAFQPDICFFQDSRTYGITH